MSPAYRRRRLRDCITVLRDAEGHLPEWIVRAVSRLHAAGFRLTGGRAGGRLVNNDVLLLTTAGRRTGRAHTVPLLYLREGERLVVIASYGGRHLPPDWYRNLTANPEAEVRLRRRRIAVTARTVDGADRPRLWAAAVAAYPGYAAYQERTPREIPLVILEPRGK
jgi:deazaflavin-dependent oxidoreductase (nitroreductase family)